MIKPGKGAFYAPPLSVGTAVCCVRPAASSSELVRGRTLSLWDTRLHTFVSQVLAQASGIVCFVCNKLVGTLPDPSGLGSYGNLIKNRLGKGDLMESGTVKMNCQRKPGAVGHKHPFSSIAFPCGTNRISPFLAEAKLPSMKALSQIRRFCSLRLSSTARHIFSQTPVSSQRFSLRQQVTGEPNRLGISDHLAPVRSTQRMPSRVRLSSALGRPILLCGGKSGSITAHCLSLICSSLMPIS